MSALETAGSRGVADGSRALGPSQALAFPQLTGLLALTAWCGLTLASGGVDVGIPTAGDGAAEWTTAVAVAVGAALAVAMMWRTRTSAVWRSLPFGLAAGGAAGLAGWAGVSILWSPEPHLAWIEANQLALALVGLVVAAALASGTDRAGGLLVTGLAIAGTPAVIMSLAVEALPTHFGSDLEPGRLSGPLDSPNTLATVIAVCLPGVLWVAGSRSNHWRLPLTGAWVALLVTALALTLSRSGFAAALVAIAIVLVGTPLRGRALTTLFCGLLGAVPPALYGLSTDVLTQDRVATELRRDEGLELGALIIGGLIVAALLAAAGGVVLDRIRPGGLATVLLLVLVLALPAAAFAANAPSPGAQDRDAIANDPERVLSISSNNRLEWWGEAVKGWRDRPLTGNGAGSFSLVHLREREDGDPRFNVRQPHQIVLKALSDLGVVGLGLLLLVASGAAVAAVRVARSGSRRRWALPVAVIGAFVVEAQLDVSLSVPALALPAFAATGVVIAEAARGRRAAAALRFEPVLAGAAVLVALLLGGSALVPAYGAEKVRAAERALLDGESERALALSDEARELNPLAIAPLEMAASAHRERGDFGAMLASLREATELQPDNARTWRRLALVLTGLGGDEEAREAWKRVLELDPKNRRALEALAQPAG
ncbi:MAG: tetratricopeptide repeat protein [Thermoleophilia bacterium]|nr:tetratricopeptide repeat protein [Thermoleophilia bacterium]